MIEENEQLSIWKHLSRYMMHVVMFAVLSRTNYEMPFYSSLKLISAWSLVFVNIYIQLLMQPVCKQLSFFSAGAFTDVIYCQSLYLLSLNLQNSTIE